MARLAVLAVMLVGLSKTSLVPGAPEKVLETALEHRGSGSAPAAVVAWAVASLAESSEASDQSWMQPRNILISSERDPRINGWAIAFALIPQGIVFLVVAYNINKFLREGGGWWR